MTSAKSNHEAVSSPTFPRLRRGLAVLALVGALGSMPACHVHTHHIGGGPTLPDGVGEESVRQFYWLFGLVHLNEVNVQRMAGDLTSYEVRSEASWQDLLLAPILGLFTITSRTVTVKR